MNLGNFLNIDTQTIARIPGVYWLYNCIRLIFAPSYRQDGLSTVHNTGFIKEQRFKQAYDAGLKQEKLNFIHWRMHVLTWAAEYAIKLQGDFVECGVNRGFFSTTVMTYIDFKSRPDRKFYLFDTFSGLVPEQIKVTDKAAHRRLYPDCYEFVVDSFLSYSNVVIVKGVVPETLSTVEINKVAYLSIDMNCAEPEVAALKYFWPKIVKGGIVVLDDYAYSGYQAQKDRADEFARSVNTQILSLPTGQGLLIKS